MYLRSVTLPGYILHVISDFALFAKNCKFAIMELVLKNVKKKHLMLIAELAKTLNIEVSEPIEDDAYYLAAMEEGEKTGLLNEQQKMDFIASLKVK